MKINGSLVFDASSASDIKNLRVEKVSSLPTYSVGSDNGRVVYLTGTNALYYGSDVANNWVAIATGGNAAALQTEVDNIETALGGAVNTSGVFVPAAFSGFTYVTNPTSLTDALSQLDGALNANNTLAELDDVALAGLAGGQYLKYDSTAGMWKNDTLTLSDVTDVTVPVAELNLLNGLTATATELNVLDGISGTTVTDLNSIAGYASKNVSADEFGYLDGVTSPIQTQLDSMQAGDPTLAALAALSGTGILVETGVDTFAHRTLQAPVAGVTITNPAGIAGDPTFALADDLAALEGLTTTGYSVRTGASTWTTRQINGVTGRTVVTNGDGVSSNTDIDLDTVTDTGAGTFLKFTRDAYGRVSGTTAVVQGDITTLVDGVYVNVSGDTMTGNLIMGTNYVTMNNAPTLDTHAANKAYVDAVAAGLSWKQAVRAATTGNVTLASTTAVDGVTLVAGDRVLVKAQTAAAENGIYTFNGTGLVRASDMDAAAEFSGATVFVTEGSSFSDSGWTQTSEVVTVGTTAVNWAQFSGSSTYTWGTGLANTGNTVYVNLGAGIAELPTDEIGIDLVTDLALQLTGNLTGDKLTFVLASGSGLEQSAAGLKISAAGVTNAMLLHPSMTFNADSGNTVRSLGDTLIIAGTSVQGINTSITGSTLTITAADASASQKGVASFDATEFSVTAGNVTIGTIDNAKLANAFIKFHGDTSSLDSVDITADLGATVNVVGLGPLSTNTVVAGNTIEISVANATTTSVGVASFDPAHFTVSAGAVSLAATLDDLDNVSSADAATAGDLLTKTAGDWQPVSRAGLLGTQSINDLGDVTVSTPAGGQVLSYNGSAWVNKKIYHVETVGTASTTWTVSHALGVKYCNVTIVDATDEVVIPQSITFDSTSQLTVTFNTAIAGKAVVMGIA